MIINVHHDPLRYVGISRTVCGTDVGEFEAYGMLH